MKTIVLTGMMGSGKTTVAKLLAVELGCGFVDLDCEIEKAENRSISEIFDTDGEVYFREIERKIISEVFNSQNQIISLGGGTFENNDTQNFLLENSIVIYLETSAEQIFERIKNDSSRPLLASDMSVEKIQSFIEKRKQNYELAQFKIITDNQSPDEVLAEILGVLRND